MYPMKNLKLTFSILLLTFFLEEFSHAQDWPNLNRFKNENAELGLPSSGENRVVFMGNSITEGWGDKSPGFFPGKPYINRGISGQTADFFHLLI